MADEGRADGARCPQIMSGDYYKHVLSALQGTQDLCSNAWMIEQSKTPCNKQIKSSRC